MTTRAVSGTAAMLMTSLMLVFGGAHCGSSDGPASLLGHATGSTSSSGSTSDGAAANPPTSSADDGGTGNGAGGDDSSSAPPPISSDGGAVGTPGVDASVPLGRLVAYASGYSKMINVFSVDETTGALTLDTDASVASFGSSPSFLAVNPAHTNLYAVDEETNGQVGAYAIDPATGALTFLNAVSSGGQGPPFVRVDATGKWVFVANYDNGTASVLPVQSGGKLGQPLSTFNAGTNAHMMIPDPSNHFVFVPCLGSDYVAQYVFDDTTGALTPNAVPHFATAKGAGPRHLAFHPNGKLAYLLNETNSTLTTCSFDATAGTLTSIETQSTLPSTFTGTNTAAEVWVDASGTHVFTSNRGADDIAVFAIDSATGKLTSVGYTPSGGQQPRDFTLAPSGTFLYTANQTTGNVVPFKLDPVSGALTATANPVTITAASYVGLVRLPATGSN